MGNVYFVQCGHPDDRVRNMVKVGYARNVERRLVILQTGNPFKLHLLAVLTGVEPRIERHYHAALNEHLVRGEWFVLGPPLKALIHHIQNGARPVDPQQIQHYMSLMTAEQLQAWPHIKARWEKKRAKLQREAEQSWSDAFPQAYPFAGAD